jgi:hypothetical protein
MKHVLISLLFLTFSCGKKQEPVSESKPASVSAPADKVLEETPPPPAEVPVTADPEPVNKEIGVKSLQEDSAATGDATPAAQPGPTVDDASGKKDEQLKRSAPTPLTTKGGGGGSAMSALGSGPGESLGGPSVDGDKPSKDRLKRPAKPNPQTTGYHGMDQDEPVQE